jgi:hypothetical protein
VFISPSDTDELAMGSEIYLCQVAVNLGQEFPKE